MIDFDNETLFRELINQKSLNIYTGWKLSSNNSKNIIRKKSELLTFEQRWTREVHKYSEIFICAKGTCGIEIEGNVYRMNEGELFIILPGVQHCELSEIGENYIGIWIIIDLMSVQTLTVLNISHNEKYVHEDVAGHLTNIFYSIMFDIKKEITENSLFVTEMTQISVKQILIHLYREIVNNKHKNEQPFIWKSNITKEIKEYIEKNINEKINLKGLAEHFYLSPNYLNSIFKSDTGHTIINYVEERKLETTKILLDDKSISMKNIALTLGFYDQYHFSKRFKKHFGISPSAYRKKLY